jgi:hypothetical protein
MAKPIDHTELHAEAKARYERCLERESENHEHWLEAMEAYEGRGQWPESVRAERESDDKPCLTFNQFPRFVNQVVNEFRKNPPQIKVRPVDSQADPATAEMFGGLIRNIEDQSQSNQVYENQGKTAVIGGWGVVKVNYDYYDQNSYYPEIRIEGVEDPLHAIPGPYTKPDGSDAEYWIETKLVTKKEFTDSDYEDADWDLEIGAADDKWREDTKLRIGVYWYYVDEKRILALTDKGATIDVTKGAPLDAQIVSQKERTVKAVRRATMTGNRVLLDEAWPGSMIPLVPVIGEEIRFDGRVYRYGMVKNGLDAQMAYNMIRSTVIEKASLGPHAPWVGPDTAFKGYEDVWNTANTANHAWLPFGGQVSPVRTITETVSQGEMALAGAAAEDLQATMGITDAGLGMSHPGDAAATVLLKQKEADTSVFNWTDNLARAVQSVGRILVDLLPKVYNSQRYARIKGVDQQTKLVQLNTEYIDEDGIQRFYDLSRGCYDVSVSVGQSFSTMREESANAMLEMIRTDPNLAQVLGPRLLETLDFPQAREIAAEIRQMQQAKQGQAQDPVMMATQIEGIKSQASIQIKQATSQADAQLANQKFELSKQEAIFKAQQQREMDQFEANLQMDIARTNAELKMQEINANLAFKKDEAMLRLHERHAESMPMDIQSDVLEQPARFSDLVQTTQSLAQNMAQLAQMLAQIQQTVSAPREAIRDEKGNLIGSKVVLQ